MYGNGYKKEQKWKQVFMIPTKDGKEIEKTVFPRSIETKKENERKVSMMGGRLVKCEKLYPFSTQRNQHNFMLISTICSNKIYDILNGQAEGNLSELQAMKDKADEFFSYPLPVAWVPWATYQEMRELSFRAEMHREERNVEAQLRRDMEEQ